MLGMLIIMRTAPLTAQGQAPPLVISARLRYGSCIARLRTVLHSMHSTLCIAPRAWQKSRAMRYSRTEQMIRA